MDDDLVFPEYRGIERSSLGKPDKQQHASSSRKRKSISPTSSKPVKNSLITDYISAKKPAEPAKSDDPVHCPLCPMSLADMDEACAQRHVNACLDGRQPIDVEAEAEAQRQSLEKKQSVIRAWKSFYATAKTRIGETFGYGFDTAVKKVAVSSSEATSSSTLTAKPVKETSKKKECPFYKKMPGTSFVVDAFLYGKVPDVSGYFLSHFHSDHYMGLKASFDHGIIYCSSITASLVEQQIRVNPKFIVRLPMNEFVTVDGVEVMLIDANHCPGSVLFLFRVQMKAPQKPLEILHTGDFRAHQTHLCHPEIKNRTFDIVYLDTTYCNPNYKFPPQDEMVKQVASFCRYLDSLPISSNPLLDCLQKKMAVSGRTLFAVGTYLIGKERIFVGIAKELNSLIYADKRKTKILSCLQNKEISDRIIDVPSRAQVHVIRMMDLKLETLLTYLEQHKERFDRIVAFRPTGWEFSKSPSQRNLPLWLDPSKLGQLKISAASRCGKAVIVSVPYSEHSSFSELEMFIKGVNVKRIIPTVNHATEESRNKMQAIFSQWKR